MSKHLILLVALTSPLLLWAAIVAAARNNLFTLRSMLRVLNVWHWVAVTIGAALIFKYEGQPPARYGWGFLIFSFGLIPLEQWLIRRIEPRAASTIPRS